MMHPFDEAWEVIKFMAGGSQGPPNDWDAYVSYVINLYEAAQMEDDAARAELQQLRENNSDQIASIIRDWNRQQEQQHSPSVVGVTAGPPDLFGQTGGQTMEAETQAFERGGMWFSYPSGRIIGDKFPEGYEVVDNKGNPV